MSTTTQNPNVDTYIPSDEEVATPSGRRPTYRFADGSICTGREADNSLVVIEKLVGRLRRVGIYSGNNKTTGIPYSQAEADIETAQGMVRLKGSLTDQDGVLRPPVSTLSLVEGLLDIAKDELMLTKAGQSSKPNRFNKFSTYANVYHLDAVTKRTSETRRLDRDKTSTPTQQWQKLESLLRAHPAFKDRPISETDHDEDGSAATHLAALCVEMKDKGWVTPEQAPAEWLSLMAAYWQKPERAGLRDWSDDEWGGLRLAVRDLPQIPAMLAPAQSRINGGAAPAPGNAAALR